MGTLNYGLNHRRKEVFCLGKHGKYSIVQPMWDGATDEEIIAQEISNDNSTITRERFTDLVARVRAFAIHEVVHEDYMDSSCAKYEDYTYKDSVYINDEDKFGKTVKQYNDENGY
jgi:hypothetical protein